MVFILQDGEGDSNKKDHDDDSLIDRFVGGEGHGGIIGEVVGRVKWAFIFFY